MSLQQTITRLIMKLPGGILVKMAGGKPLTIRGRTLEPSCNWSCGTDAMRRHFPACQPKRFRP
jgi:hypothetical protein